MTSYKEALASGNAYFASARRLEMQDPDKAAIVYMKAYRELNRAYQLARTMDEANFAKGKSEEAKARANLLTMKDIAVRKAGLNGSSGTGTLDEVVEEYETDLDFSAVAGMEELKNILTYAVIRPILNRELYKKYVKGSIDGFLLFGPPGCGKTYIARALAGEMKKQVNANGQKLHVYMISSAEILNSWVGESEKMVKNLFETAKKNAPALIIFDEADALLSIREGKTDYADRVVNQFLSCFDDIKDKEVYFILTSNFPWKLDPAIVRSGRIGNHIYIGLPDKKARAELFKYFLSDLKTDHIDIDYLASITEGYSPAEIESICKLTGIEAFNASLDTGTEQLITQKSLEEKINKKEPQAEMWFKIAREKMPQEYEKWFSINTT